LLPSEPARGDALRDRAAVISASPEIGAAQSSSDTDAVDEVKAASRPARLPRQPATTRRRHGRALRCCRGEN